MSVTSYLSDSRLRVSRRGFLKAGGVGAAAVGAGALGAVPLAASRASAQNGGWDAEHDVVVVGSGAAGFAAAITARALGSDVVLFEKGAYAGGTTIVSGGGMWIPNSSQMREMGLEDPRPEALKYMARYSWPHLYDPEGETLGLPQHDYDMIATYYDTAAEAMDFIQDTGAIEYQVSGGYGPDSDQLQTDYMDHFPEDVAPKGRTLMPAATAGGAGGGGGDLIGAYQAWSQSNGIPILLNHRVERLILNDAGQVIGVEVSVNDPAQQTATPEPNVGAEADGTPVGGAIPVVGTPELEATPAPPTATVIAVRARKGVIFGSGGFSRNADMMHHLMPAPYYGGCAAPTNEGDLLRMSSAVSAKLGNLHNVWRNEGIFEQAVASSDSYNCIWYYNGDSFLMVNKTGRRFVNEKRNYQDRPMAHHHWDANNADWTNRLGFLIYDSRQVTNWPRYPFAADGETTPYVITGNTLEELAAAIDERVEGLKAASGGVTLADDFASTLADEISRFNEFARTGEDLDFQRGAFGYDRDVPSGPIAEEPTIEYPSADQPNVAMYPLSDEGPYYAIIIAASAVDTNGGPVINTDGQVVTWDDRPVEGLYAAGACTANPSVNAYWGGGTTLGHAHVWGYRAAQHAHASSEKTA
ncbi:MAG TPA: FAD-dependent oxidoreductase [Thermomicrobiales bacterium]|jgi:hypothetical protein|nr:FAD-dependent oxidoreductase [Thermomicrobiales bacterium]